MDIRRRYEVVFMLWCLMGAVAALHAAVQNMSFGGGAQSRPATLMTRQAFGAQSMSLQTPQPVNDQLFDTGAADDGSRVEDVLQMEIALDFTPATLINGLSSVTMAAVSLFWAQSTIVASLIIGVTALLVVGGVKALSGESRAERSPGIDTGCDDGRFVTAEPMSASASASASSASMGLWRSREDYGFEARMAAKDHIRQVQSASQSRMAAKENAPPFQRARYTSVVRPDDRRVVPIVAAGTDVGKIAGRTSGVVVGGAAGVVGGLLAAPFTFGVSVPAALMMGAGIGYQTGQVAGSTAGGLFGNVANEGLLRTGILPLDDSKK